MRTTALCLAMFFVLTTPARADMVMCPSGSPGSSACAEPAVAEVAKASSEKRSLDQALRSFFWSTGNLTRPGDFHLSLQGFGLFNSLSYGVSERIEISASAPVVAVLGSVGVRVGLTPADSPLRLVVGGHLWTPWVATGGGEDREYVTQVSATVAYQTERTNVHATVTQMQPNVDGLDPLTLGSAGVLIQTADRFALMADLTQVNSGNWIFCSYNCPEDLIFNTASAGLKYLGKNWDIDAGVVLIADARAEEAVLMPLLSAHRRY